jgi:uncharacterized protein (DUF2225 family)
LRRIFLNIFLFAPTCHVAAESSNFQKIKLVYMHMKNQKRKTNQLEETLFLKEIENLPTNGEITKLGLTTNVHTI